MKIFVVNAGSSSLKYQLIDMETEEMIAKGNCERIGDKDAFLEHKTADGRQFRLDTEMPTHKEAFGNVIFALTESDAKVIDSLDEINGIGHRVVQGGDIYDKSILLDDEVIANIDKLSALAPLHNPAHVIGMKSCIEVFGKDKPQVAVFDTSFHQTMPPKAYMFPIPYEYYEKYHIRRYGAHGTSHKFVSGEAAKIMGKDPKDLKIVTCHLGNGASLTAVDGGKCVDTSMGLTPLGGFAMGTRSGDLDPSVVTYLAEKENLSPAEMNTLLNKKSGVLGVSCYSNDNRDVVAKAEEGDEKCKLALEIQKYQIVKFIGAYAAAMNGLDCIVITGGIGENNSDLREDICESLTFMGIDFDKKFNAENQHARGKVLKLSTDASKVAVYVIPTNEELAIARDTMELIK